MSEVTEFCKKHAANVQHLILTEPRRRELERRSQRAAQLFGWTAFALACLWIGVLVYMRCVK